LAGEQKDDRIERIISQRLAASRIAGDAGCPGASTIAAYFERTLPAAERTDYERHLAQCARCASALAALARIDDAHYADHAHDAIEPGGIANRRAAGGENRGSWRRRRPLPLAAFAAAAAILIVFALRTLTAQRNPIGGETRSAFPARPLAGDQASGIVNPAPLEESGDVGSTGNSMMAMNEAARAQPASPARPESLASKMEPAPAEPRPQARELEQSRNPPSAEDLRQRLHASKLAKEQVKVAATDEVAVPSAAPAAVTSATSPTSPSTPLMASAPSALFDAAHVPAPSPPPAPSADHSIVAGASASPSSGVIASSRLAPSNLAGFAATTPGTSATGIATIPVPTGAAAILNANTIAAAAPNHTPAAIWIVGARGAISRYSPATGWTPQTSGVTTDLTRGSAPSTTTCWVVGRGGTILRTVDGEHWTKVAAPVGDDLAEVVASSASDATITAAGGRRFGTSDGGVTWRPLQ
jgi:hypothetical protein